MSHVRLSLELQEAGMSREKMLRMQICSLERRAEGLLLQGRVEGEDPWLGARWRLRGGLLEEEAREDGGCRWSGSATTVVLPVKRVLDGAALEWGDDGGGRG